MNIPKQLIGLLNSGRCIAIVGSGPSCELSYPSWGSLAESTIAHTRGLGLPLDDDLFARLMKANDYPRVFKYLQEVLGRTRLVDHIRNQLPSADSSGKAYEMLVKWPFRFYMTTNWDSEIQTHLDRIGQHFTEISNSHPELTQITDETSRQVVMLHGVLSDPSSVVLTEDDYQAFKVADERKYFRDTLKSVLRTLPAVVVGHSMRDPDLQTILEAAKTIAPSQRPIYMIVADPSREDVDTFRDRYNICLIGYKWDSSHSHFLRLLSVIDKFVVPRTGAVVRPVDPPPQEEVEVATSLLVYNSLSNSLDKHQLLDRLVGPQVLQALKSGARPMRTNDVRGALIPEALRTLPTIGDRLEEALTDFQAKGYLTGSELNGWTLTQAGEDHLSSISTAQNIEDDQVYGALTGKLGSLGIPRGDCNKAAHALKTAILSVFRRRGIAAASLTFRGQQFEPVDMAELFESISTSIEWSTSFELREAYIEFAMRLFSQPTAPERRYLARVSQGLFAVHVFGVDPAGAEARADVFRNVAWFLDSNVLIHLLALGSSVNGMSTEICRKCKALNIRLLASEGVVAEAYNSLEWASNMCSGLQAHEEMEFILHVFKEEGYRENPYIAGFVALQQEMHMRRFSEYRKHLGITDKDSVTTALATHGICVVGIDRLPIDHTRRKSFPVYKNKILVERERRGTARGGDFQAHVEAELLCLILGERDAGEGDERDGLSKAYFVSTSRLLDHVFRRECGTLTWRPDVFFRHLSLISPSEYDIEALIESLGTELADMGMMLVDEEAYRNFFDPLVCSSRMSFERERDAFVKSLEGETHATPEELQREFEMTPDFDKPLFVAQMRWRAGATATAELQRELKAADQQKQDLANKLKANEEEWQRKHKETVRHLENRIRNLTDPTRRKKLKQKSKNKRKRRKRRK